MNKQRSFIKTLGTGIGLLLAYSSAANNKVGFELKHDETVVFFPTDAAFDSASAMWHIPVHGWVFEPENSLVRKGLAASILENKYELKLNDDNDIYFSERINLLLADNERGKRLWIELCGQTFALNKSKPDGHFHSLVKISQKNVSECNANGFVEFKLLLANSDTRTFHGQSRLLNNEGLSIISDIDDTVKITQVTDKKRLLDNTFYQPFRAVEGMPAAYQNIVAEKASIHFVSSSPWHLFPVLNRFREEVGLPWATYSLKSIRLKDSTILNLFKPGDKTKPKQIKEILKQFPNRKFVFIGDSGEKDPEVYAKLLREHPEQVLGFAIRVLNNSEAERFDGIFDNLDAQRYLLFEDPSVLPGFIRQLQEM